MEPVKGARRISQLYETKVPPMVQSRARKKVVLFFALVAAFSTVIALMQAFLPEGTRLLVITWSPGVADASKMWSVGIAGLIALLAVDGSVRDAGWRLCPPRWFVIAAAVQLGSGLAVYAAVWVSGIGGFRGVEFFLYRLAITPLRLPPYLLFAAGEEIGWRGVLVPNLARGWGFAVSALVPGAAWAVWHYPDILFFGYNAGLPPVYAVTCFTVTLVAAGVFFTWLRLVSGSVWPAVFAHGLGNAIGGGVFERTTENGPLTSYVASEFGAGAAVAAIAVAYVFWKRRAAADQVIAGLSHDKEDGASASSGLRAMGPLPPATPG
jgi:membrane protease YdiL (CAAX protease family)